MAFEEQSMLEFYASALGPIYLVALPLSALMSFGIALAVVIVGKGPTVGPALVLATLFPMLVGLMGTVSGMMAAYMVISMSPTEPSPAAVAAGWSTALVSLHAGVIGALPTLLTGLIGGGVRALFGRNG